MKLVISKILIFFTELSFLLFKLRLQYALFRRSAEDSASHHQKLELVFQQRKLRGLLAATPWWVRGHLLLAQLALQNDDIATSYASTQAVMQLVSPASTSFDLARRLLARCFLRRNAAAQAEAMLVELSQKYPSDYEVIEDLAACYVARSAWLEAEREFGKIPFEQLGAEARAALEYVKQSAKNSA